MDDIKKFEIEVLPKLEMLGVSPKEFPVWIDVLAKYETKLVSDACLTYITSEKGKYKPKPWDIISLIQERPKPKKEENTETIECNMCNRRGFVEVIRYIDGCFYDYQFRCSCQNGEKYSGLQTLKSEARIYEGKLFIDRESCIAYKSFIEELSKRPTEGDFDASKLYKGL